MSNQRMFRVAPGREPEMIEALMAASKDKNKALAAALECLRSMKLRVDGVCWSTGDEKALCLLEAARERYGADWA